MKEKHSIRRKLKENGKIVTKLILFSWIIAVLINCSTLHLYLLNQQVLPSEEEIWILNIMSVQQMFISITLNCQWAPDISPYGPPIKPKRMVLKKLGEARAFKMKGRKRQVFGTWLPAVSSGQLQRLLTQTLSLRQHKGVAESSPSMPRMMISLSLTHSARHP